MSTFALSLMLLIGAAQEGKLTPPPSGKTDAAAALKEAAGKAASAGSYTYESTSDMSGGGFGGGGGGAPGGAPGGPPGGGAGGGAGGGRGGGGGFNSPTTGKVVIGKHAELKRGDTLAYKIGDKLVYKKGEAWEQFVAPDPSAGGGAPGGGRGGGGGGGREMFTLSRLASSPLPHELLNGLETKVKDVTTSTAGGKTTYTGTLNEQGVKDLGGGGGFGGGGFGGGAGGGAGAGGNAPAMTTTGTASLVVNAAGQVEQLVIETKTSSQRGDFTVKRTIAFKEWGATKVEVPKEAAAKVTG